MVEAKLPLETQCLPAVSPDVILLPATPNRKRGKSMSFRSGQSGTVVRKSHNVVREVLR